MNRVEPILYHLCHLLLGGLFVYAGSLKAADVEAFAGTVAAYHLLPYAGNVLVAATLPYIEVLAGLLLLTGSRVRASALLIGLLTLFFMVILATVLVRGLEIDCGCFGSVGSTSPAAALWRDAGMLLLAVATFVLRGRRPQR